MPQEAIGALNAQGSFDGRQDLRPLMARAAILFRAAVARRGQFIAFGQRPPLMKLAQVLQRMGHPGDLFSQHAHEIGALRTPPRPLDDFAHLCPPITIRFA